MLKNYLSIAFRHLYKRKFYTLINVLGLSVALTACILISLYVLDELSYDRFHEKADRIYRVTNEVNFNGQESSYASTNYHVAEVIDDEIPEIESTLRVEKLWNQTIKLNDDLYSGIETIGADSNFFSFFTFPLLEGNPATVLSDPSSVILTEELAQVLFKRSTDVIGESVEIGGEVYKVSAVAENPPANAHFHFEMIRPFEPRQNERVNWGSINGLLSTYFLLSEHASVEAVPEKIKAVCIKYNPDIAEGIKLGKFEANFIAQPLSSIHLYSDMDMELEANSDIRYVYIFSLIALFVLIIAGVNYVNLSTARSADRAKEIGIRKTLGSMRQKLIAQFLVESLLVSLCATLLSLGMAELFRHPFNQLAGKALSFNLFDNPFLGLVLLMVGLGVGVLAGIYPAFYLTRFQPVQVLRGALKTGREGRRFRNSLVVFQFSITIALIICTGIVYQQLQYMQNKKLGYDQENVVLLSNAVEDKYETFVNEVKAHPQVQFVTASSQSPHLITNAQGGLTVKGQGENQAYQLNRLFVDYDFLSAFDIPLKEGRNFSRAHASDSMALILNEAAVRQLGLDDPMQSEIDRDGEMYHVVGVVEDFHFQSLHNEIAPLFILLGPNPSYYNDLEIRISGEDVPGTLAFLEESWKKFTPDTPFNFSFLNQDYEALYRTEMRLGKVFGIFTGLAIFVACLGLLALVAFMAEQRSKEIGIRKVLGASARSIIILLSQGYTKLILLSLLLAVPLSYLAMQQWLADYAYRVNMDLWIFLGAGIAALLIAWLAVSFQAIKAATANPVDSLRNE
ncbi:ABC transporter permease [Catalinimonas niigatensis]|uniref:ABC transporter permease n=1 Tax=Catalinimonas niigatensis TaxID=1397264 RepID=UPI0026660F26|nr:ABC transporter permease [Catalinimonas niigatensis]WPP48829.1 FtsX-like permease family protein [Catalinimonas niigatensis]